MASQAVATREDNQYSLLTRQLDTRAAEFKKALPSHITPEKLQRTVMTAAQSNPDLLKADRASLITACMKAAQDGLLPDGREAALVVFSTSKKEGNQWVKIQLVQYMPMVFGLRKKILQSGEISSIETNVVYLAELQSGAFYYEAGTDAALRHRPDLTLSDEDTTDDKIVAAYSVATMKDGTKSFEVMRRSEINKVRQTSQTGKTGGQYGPKGPWVDWFGEMARKTVMRRHSKTLPMSGDLIDVEAADEALAARSTERLLEAEPDAPRALPPTRDDVEDADPAHDPETGEIEDEEEIARRLDAETTAHLEGRSDEDHGDQHDGNDIHPAQAIADDLIQRCKDAAILGDVIGVEGELSAHRAAMPEQMVAGVDDAIAEARARFGKGAK